MPGLIRCAVAAVGGGLGETDDDEDNVSDKS